MSKGIKQTAERIKSKLNPKTAYPAIAISVYIVAVAVIIMFAVTIGPRMQKSSAVTYDNTVTGLSYPTDYTETEIKSDMVYKGALMLVNSSYECKVNGINLMNINEKISPKTFTLSNYNIEINDVVISSISNMLGDFYNLKGENDISMSCGYRSKELQQEIYNNSVEENGEAYAKKYVQVPGYSEHQTGYAFDLAIVKDGITSEYNGEGDFKWINENCARYGLIVRYNADKVNLTGISNEQWHFRYVGVPHAMYMTQNNLCLEEYIEKLRGRTVEAPLVINDAQMNTYLVYYYKATGDVTKVPVPKDKSFEISGNNKDGFIVTVHM